MVEHKALSLGDGGELNELIMQRNGKEWEWMERFKGVGVDEHRDQAEFLEGGQQPGMSFFFFFFQCRLSHASAKRVGAAPQVEGKQRNPRRGSGQVAVDELRLRAAGRAESALCGSAEWSRAVCGRARTD